MSSWVAVHVVSDMFILDLWMMCQHVKHALYRTNDCTAMLVLLYRNGVVSAALLSLIVCAGHQQVTGPTCMFVCQLAI